MAPAPKKVDYEKENVERENESSANIVYDVHDDKHTYHKRDRSKGVEKHCTTKYKTGCSGSGGGSGRLRLSSSSSASRKSRSPHKSHHRPSHQSPHRHNQDHSQHSQHRQQQAGAATASSAASSSKSQRLTSRSAISAKCYEVKPGKRHTACPKGELWQRGKYVRDKCGSGVLPKRFDFMPSRRLWCKTPLSMYQATIGELARKILCRETVVPRDVKPEPPCNIREYILPPCGGYYRKYDCVPPCEEDYAYVKGGKKLYRDRVERYWQPCLTRDQKIKLDVNEYAPQNAFLAKQLRRYNMRAGDTDLPCW